MFLVALYKWFDHNLMRICMKYHPYSVAIYCCSALSQESKSENGSQENMSAIVEKSESCSQSVDNLDIIERYFS